jgi:hypothetical protein
MGAAVDQSATFASAMTHRLRQPRLVNAPRKRTWITDPPASSRESSAQVNQVPLRSDR